MGLRTQNTSTAQIEAEKIARMKELLKKGDAEVPKRSQSIATNLVSVDTFAMQTPNPER